MAKAEEKTTEDKKPITPDTIPPDLLKESSSSTEKSSPVVQDHAVIDSADGDDKKRDPDQIADDNSYGEDKSSGADEQCHFWGNSYSLKFHQKSCPFAQAMNPRHVQFLKNAREALELGERPCRYCLPPYSLDVSCKILLRSINGNRSDNSAERKAPGNAI